jgi:hypothetical protein
VPGGPLWPLGDTTLGSGRGAVASVLVARIACHGLLRIEAEVLGVGAEEAASIDRGRDDIEFLALESLEIAAGDASIAFRIFQGKAACFAGTNQPLP